MQHLLGEWMTSFKALQLIKTRILILLPDYAASGRFTQSLMEIQFLSNWVRSLSVRFIILRVVNKRISGSGDIFY